MLNVFIPSSKELHFKNLCLDLNGTIAFNRNVIDSVPPMLDKLKDILDIYVLTADTFSNAADILTDLPVKIYYTDERGQSESKARFIAELGAENTIAIGNGYNDRLMLAKAGLSIAVIGREGACFETISNADIVVTDIADALDLLLNPGRIAATLRD